MGTAGKTQPKTQAWERRKGESVKAFAVFQQYRDIGFKRSLEALHQTDTKDTPRSLDRLKRLSARWDWVERCREWDNHLDRIRTEEIVKDAQRTERRRLAQLEKDYKLGDELQERARLMLKWPLQRETRSVSKDGKTETIIIEPGRWTIRDAIAMIQAGSELVHRHCAAFEKDVSAMSDEELEAIMSVTLERNEAAE